ncbi:MAG: NAD(P)/FAD-dependent oxidoreductase [Candidatus Lambdaproteobacteria bacterium]|nr:NAD(P)/FAD-dependent oxidoreductase [Candidatus Lambdaproteobacteria bacterium]
MRHVIVGAGPAGVIAAETLRAADAQAEITLLGDESPAPYSRMAIPYYLADRIAEEGMLLRKEPGHFERLRIACLQQTVTAVDAKAKSVRLGDGRRLPYDRLLIATGSRPVAPPIPGLAGAGVHPCWSLADARAIHRLAAKGARVALIGGGFIGSIVMNALHARGVRLTVVEMEHRLVPKMMNQPAGLMLQRWCERQGVTVLTATRIARAKRNKTGVLALELSGGKGKPIEAELVIVATGVQPRIDFLAGSGVKTGQGVLVDDHLQTNVPEIYAAGDVAEGPDVSGGTGVHPIQPTAAEHGRVAALNMAGRNSAYRGSLIMNVLDTVGLVSHSFGQWAGVAGGSHAELQDDERFRYTRLELVDDRIVGAIVVGRTEGVGILRGLIQTRARLGPWKERLLKDPGLAAAAFQHATQSAGHAPLARRSA